MNLFKSVLIFLSVIFIFGLNPASVFADNSQCVNTPPTGAPNLYQLIPAQSSVTLYFVPPQTSFEGFTVSYGLTQDADSHVIHFEQIATGTAVKYTVNGLTAQGQYYFKVQATNYCASGQWSNVMSVQNRANQSSLLVAGPNNNILFIGGIGGMVSILLGFALFAFL